MASIVARLQAGETVEVVDRCDDICRACPHRKGSICGASEEAKSYIQSLDSRARAQLEMAVGKEFIAT